MRSILLAMICGVAMSACGAQTLPQLNRLYVFGDSYSDTGRGWQDGDGPTAVAYLAARMKTPLKLPNGPHKADDSLNFAVSGARTGEGAGYPVPGGILGFGMKNQVAQFSVMVKAGSVLFDPAMTLFFLAGGLNDRNETTATTVANLTAEIQTLYDLGGRRFSVAVLPEKIKAFQEVAHRLNPALRALPADLSAKLSGATITTSEWGMYFDRVMAHPDVYGITDTENACAGRVIFGEDARPCASPESHYFYHASHPSTAVHRAVGEMLYAAMVQGTDAGKPVRILLWKGTVPLAQGSGDADVPWMEMYTPVENPMRAAVLVCPGGGYHGLSMEHEGEQIARWLTARGVTAFVLRYRVVPYQYPVPMLDAERAMRLIRHGAEDYGLAADKIGVWGFSAGGHLASFLVTHFDGPLEGGSADDLSQVSARPDFAVLAYPVISMESEVAHVGSRENLLGKTPDPKLEAELSSETQVKPDSPPLFLLATTDDAVVPVRNSVLLYEAYVAKHLPVEMHLFEHGPHGVGLAGKFPGASAWPGLLQEWLIRKGWMAGKP